MTNTQDLTVPARKKTWIPIAFIILVALYFIPFKAWIIDTNNAGYVKIVTKFGGQMFVKIDPGLFMLNFGKAEEYKKAGSFIFGDIKKMPKVSDRSSATSDRIEVRFNDGGVAWVSGYVRFVLPANMSAEKKDETEKKLIAIQKKFRSYDLLAQTGIRQLVIESVQLSATMMTSEESYTTKRSELSENAWDQVLKGIYLTIQKPTTVTNKETGELTTRYSVEVKMDPVTGKPMRKGNPLAPYGIAIAQFVLTQIDYEDGIKTQIATKRQALMETISIRANAEKAIQERLTAEEVGKMNVVVARYKADVNKIWAVIKAEQEKNVAEIGASKELEVAKILAKATEFEKKAMETDAEADFQVKRMKFMGDNALEQKLLVLKKASIMWANAFAKAPQALVSRILLSGGGSQSNGGVEKILQMFMLNQTKQLLSDK